MHSRLLPPQRYRPFSNLLYCTNLYCLYYTPCTNLGYAGKCVCWWPSYQAPPLPEINKGVDESQFFAGAARFSRWCSTVVASPPGSRWAITRQSCTCADRYAKTRGLVAVINNHMSTFVVYTFVHCCAVKLIVSNLPRIDSKCFQVFSSSCGAALDSIGKD